MTNRKESEGYKCQKIVHQDDSPLIELVAVEALSFVPSSFFSIKDSFESRKQEIS